MKKFNFLKYKRVFVNLYNERQKLQEDLVEDTVDFFFFVAQDLKQKSLKYKRYYWDLVTDDEYQKFEDLMDFVELKKDRIIELMKKETLNKELPIHWKVDGYVDYSQSISEEEWLKKYTKSGENN